MDSLMLNIMYVAGGLCGLGALCFIFRGPCKKLDDKILYGEGCCAKYFGCCISQQSVFYDDHKIINNDTKIKPLDK